MKRAALPTSLEFSSPGFNSRVAALVRAMERNIHDRQPFDASVPPHSELTEALHRVAHGSQAQPEPGELLVRYADNTRGRPFPVRHLWPVPEPVAWQPRLELGTLSFRHLDYDSRVDLYLIRHRETRGLPQGAVENLAASRMREILASPALAAGGCINVYQTGLEPLVVGLYRAVTEHFMARAGADEVSPLYIRPIYFANEEKPDIGSVWGQV